MMVGTTYIKVYIHNILFENRASLPHSHDILNGVKIERDNEIMMDIDHFCA